MAKVAVGLVLVEECDVDRGGIAGENGPAGVRNREDAAADACEEPGPFEMDLGPAEPVHEPRLPAAGEQFGPFGVGQAKVMRDRAAQGGERPFAAVGRATEEREKDLVELGMGMRCWDDWLGE